MSDKQHLLVAFEMSLFLRDLAKAWIQRAHPDWDEARVARELLRLVPEVLQRIIMPLDQAGYFFVLKRL